MRYAGLASNRGRNLRHLADRRPGGADLAVVISNHADAPVLDAARERSIPTATVERGPEESRAAHERRVLDALSSYDLDLVCLDGYMRVLTPTYLEAAPLTINVHPALLPTFPGLDVHERVLEAGVRVSGATVHVVTEEVDGGPILTQEPVPVFGDDDVASLKARVRDEGEFRAYPRAVAGLATDRITVADDRQSVTLPADIGGDDGDDDGDDGGDDGRARRFPPHRGGTDRRRRLRYGENPHQAGALYVDRAGPGGTVVDAPQRNAGAKALSYNNYNDADAALALIAEFDRPAAAVIKHTTPAGCATADTIAQAYRDALATDPMSAFGGIVALNRRCDEATATAIVDSFKEVVVAPGYTDAALDRLGERENLRVLAVDDDAVADGPPGATTVVTDLAGGRLVQERDMQGLAREDLDVVTERTPTEAQVTTMLFAWPVVKHVKSNAIVFARDTETVGIGMGQVSRVDAVRLAGMKADEHAEDKDADGAVMASDAFFPFPDGIERAAEAGVEAVVQPGGSVNDDDVIAACDELDIAMAFTGRRAFRHG